MTRAHVFTPPPHLAAAYHQHTCLKCGIWYPCYRPGHEEGTPRLCGSTGCKS